MFQEDGTNWGLIARLASRKASNDDWREFDRIYRALIRAIALQSGLRPEEVQDVEQETMQTIWKKMSQEVPDFHAASEAGSFRAWLRTVVRYRILDQLRKRTPFQSSARANGSYRLIGNAERSLPTFEFPKQKAIANKIFGPEETRFVLPEDVDFTTVNFNGAFSGGPRARERADLARAPSDENGLVLNVYKHPSRRKSGVFNFEITVTFGH